MASISSRAVYLESIDIESIKKYFFSAVIQGEKASVAHFLGFGTPIELSYDFTGKTALHLSIIYKQWAVFKYLIQYGANIHTQCQYGKCQQAPLHLAVRMKNIPMIRLLLEKGADVNAKDEGGKTPLCLAIYTENNEIVKLLLSYGADPNVVFSNKLQMVSTPLRLALRKELYALVWSLLADKHLNIWSTDFGNELFNIFIEGGFPIRFFIQKLGVGALDCRCAVLLIEQLLAHPDDFSAEDQKIYLIKVCDYLFTLWCAEGIFDEYLNGFQPGSSQLWAIQGVMLRMIEFLGKASPEALGLLESCLKAVRRLDFELNDNDLIAFFVARIRYHLLGLEDRLVPIVGGRGAHRHLVRDEIGGERALVALPETGDPLIHPIEDSLWGQSDQLVSSMLSLLKLLLWHQGIFYRNKIHSIVR
jgi:ankyrin repeat protein